MIADNERKALLKNALVALSDMQARLDASEAAKRQPIAVVGMACRFPGGANSPELYWHNMINGVDAVGPVPETRWPPEIAQQSDIFPAVPLDKWQGGFVDLIDQFDPQFFGITPREAVTMDPQQRMVLELAWQALERAGIAADSLNGSQTGVFIGISTNDYYHAVRALGHDPLDAYIATGTSLNVAAGRLSFTLGLQGPAAAIDTACSSSLTALHLACTSLRTGETDLMIAGGVNAILSPEPFPIMYKWGMLSPDGRCKVFDAGANGFVRAEGCGILVLKRLSDALADGSPILAVIRGTAVNQDGRSTGLTAPKGLAQEAVIRAALENAGVQPHEISYVEAHGTGTTLGDPIEVEALGVVLGEGRSHDQPLLLGSVKSVIGHAEAAAGVASIIKTILAMQHQVVPPNLHLHERSPQIPWPAFPIIIPTEPTPWNVPPDARRLVGVSAFGFSGTNAHIILEEPPPPTPATSEVERTHHLITLSARSAKALNERAHDLAAFMTQNAPDECDLADIAYTLNHGRAAFPYRLAFTAASYDESVSRLRAFESGQDDAGLLQNIALNERPRVAFLFTGQGAQYLNMGRALYETQPTFRAALDECDAILQQYMPGGLLPVMFGDESQADRLNHTAYTQPALFAMEYALAQLWLSWGITPHAVLGHSVGEFVAACIAGVFSLHDGLRLIATRGRLMGDLPAGGVMAAVMADEATVTDVIAPFGDAVVVATLNGPENTVIAGTDAAVQAAIEQFTARGIKTRRLKVSHAFHSPLMEPMLAEFERVLQTITFHKPKLRLAANVTGTFATDALTRPDYWLKQARTAVRFADDMQTLYDAGYRIFLEIGPNATLISMSQTFLGEATWLASLRENRDNWATMLASLGSLYTQGVPVDWAGFDRDYHRRSLILPTYPFQRDIYWPQTGQQRRPPANTAGGHPLLGQRVRSALHAETTYTQTFSSHWLHMLDDHRIYGASIYPGTGYVEMALAAGRDSGYEQITVHDVEIEQAMLIPEDTLWQSQLVLTPTGSGQQRFQVFGAPDDDTASPDVVWKRHAVGSVGPYTSTAQPDAPSLADMRQVCNAPAALEDFYAGLDKIGLNFGPSFRNLRQAWRAPQAEAALGRVELAPGFAAEAARYNLYPGLLDACFHLLGTAMDSEDADEEFISVPVAIDRLTLHRPAGTAVWCFARFRPQMRPETRTADVFLYADDGGLLAALEGLHIRRADRHALERLVEPDFKDWLYDIEWQHAPVHQMADPAGEHWLILADSSGIGAAFAAHAKSAGITCDLLFAADVPADGQPFFARQLEAPYARVIHFWSLDAAVTDIDTGAHLGLHSTLTLAQALETHNAHAKLWLVTRQAQAARNGASSAIAQMPLWGLGRVIALELPDIWGGLLDIDDTAHPGQMLAVFLAADDEDQALLRAGERYVARLEHHTAPAIDHEQAFQLTVTEKGLLENLTLVPIARRKPGRGEVEIRVHATGLNFRDVLNVLGMYPGEGIPLGTECAGIVVQVGEDVTACAPGDRVLALGGNAFNSYVTVPANMVFAVPANLTLTETASIPSVFLTAWYGLHELAHIKAGDRVLIHAAAGGVGLAAVQIAQQAGAEVFATAGSEIKHAYLRSIGVQHVMSSREPGFAEEIMAITNGQGVNIVLNSLTDEFIPESFSVLAPGGGFLEIGKRGVWTHEQVETHFPALSYHIYDLTELLLSDPDYIPNMLRMLLEQFATGELVPPPIQTFPLEAVEDAFRFMARARHIGKLVITQNGAAPVSDFRPDATYLVTGGLGGLGLKVAEWLVQSGARHLVLAGRRPPSPETQAVIQALEAEGAQVVPVQADISDYQQTAALLARITAELPPLRGVIHAAGVLADGALVQQEWSRFETVLAPKVSGAWNLHLLTETLPLDFFVLFSSGSSVLGSPGQGNYAAANAFLDGLAHYRAAHGLPGLSINWGAWSEVGMAASLSHQQQERLQAQGMRLIAPEQGVHILGSLMRLPHVQALVIAADRRYWQTAEAFLGAPALLRNLLEAHIATETTPQANGQSARDNILSASPEARAALLRDFLQQQVAAVVGASVSHLDVAIPITSLGIDSLMAVEIRNRLDKHLHLNVTVAAILDGPSILQLTETLLRQFDSGSGAAVPETIGTHTDDDQADWEEGVL